MLLCLLCRKSYTGVLLIIQSLNYLKSSVIFQSMYASLHKLRAKWTVGGNIQNNEIQWMTE